MLLRSAKKLAQGRVFIFGEAAVVAHLSRTRAACRPLVEIAAQAQADSGREVLQEWIALPLTGADESLDFSSREEQASMPLPSSGSFLRDGVQWLLGFWKWVPGIQSFSSLDEGNQAGVTNSWLPELDCDRGRSLSAPQPPGCTYHLY